MTRPEQTKLPPAIGATRVSTGPQAKAYGQEAQAQEITAYAQRQGLELLEIVPEVLSGKTDLDGRATVQRYFELARERPGLTFIFPRVDRIGRRAELILNIVRELQGRGAVVEVVGVPIDLKTKEGTLMLTVLAGIAEYDHANITNNMEQGRRRKAQAGLWPHGSLPWGYEFERDSRGTALRPVPIPENAGAIRRAFELALEGGEQYVLTAMVKEGWPAPTEKGWNRKTVVHAITNPIYTGRKAYQGIQIEFEPIVTPELFAQVQRLRQQRRGPTGVIGNRRTQPLLFTAHLFCLCGAAMGRDAQRIIPRGDHPGYHFDVYSCWKRKRAQTRGTGPHSRQYRAEHLDAQLWPHLVKLLSDPTTLAGMIAPGPTLPAPDLSRQRELEAAIERAYEPLTAGAVGYTLDIAQNLARPYAEELERLKQDAARPPAPVDLSARALAFAEALQGELTFEEKRELLAALNVRITMGEKGVQNVSVDLP